MTDTPDEDPPSQPAEDDPWSDDADLGLVPLEPVESIIEDEFDEEDFDDDFDDDFEEEDDDGYETPVAEEGSVMDVPDDDDDEPEITEPFDD